MSRFRLFLIAVTVLIVGAGGYLYWFSQTHNSLLELVNVLQPGPDEAPPTQPTTPIELPVQSDLSRSEYRGAESRGSCKIHSASSRSCRDCFGEKA